MIAVQVGNKTGLRIKPLHGVGQPPFTGIDFSRFRWLSEAGIPFSRLHDVGGAYGNNQFVDIPNVFRDFSADPEDPSSYDFAFTDLLMKALADSGVEPFYRLGVTIENYSYVRALRIDPPSDPEKWAKICEMIVRHYNEGWAEGFRFGIRYWEIWNEPDNSYDPKKNPMWTGTPEQYFELYDATSKHLKACFPDIRVGGYASCGFYDLQKPSYHHHFWRTYFDDFLEHIKKSGAPLDFFSWHSYDGIENTVEDAFYCRRRLDEEGFTGTETTLNEWNPEHDLRGSFRHGALVCGMMLALQNAPVDSAMFYDARYGLSVYGGLFRPMSSETYPAYDAFLMFNELYRRGEQLEISCSAPGVYAAAAAGDGDCCAVIANTGSEEAEFDARGKEILSCRRTGGGDRMAEKGKAVRVGPDEMVCILFR